MIRAVWAVTVLLVGLSSTGCPRIVPRGTPSSTASPEPSVAVGRRASPPGTSSPAAAAPGSTPAERTPEAFEGVLVIGLVDQNGKGAEGIPVRVEGPMNRELRSDARGLVRLVGPPGDYRFRVVVGCVGPVHVLFGESGRGGIAAGQTGQGRLNVRWQQRVGPRGPVYSSIGPTWPVGETVDIRYDVADRCSDERVPGGSLQTYRFDTSPNLRIVGTPSLTADDKGWDHLQIQCTAAGEARLTMTDTRNPGDVFDVVAADASSGEIRPSCGTV